VTNYGGDGNLDLGVMTPFTDEKTLTIPERK